MSQGPNMKMVTVRKTLKQTAKSFISWPACHEKGRACQILQAIKTRTLASSYSELPPIQHTQTAQENRLSLFIFVPFGYTSMYAKSSPNPLPSSCHYIPPVALRGFGKQLQSSGEAQGWQPWWWGVVRVCRLSQNRVTFTWFIDSLNSVFTLLPWHQSELMALIFFSPPFLFGEVYPSSTFLSLLVCEHPVEDLVCLRFLCQAVHCLYLFFSFST